MSRSNTRSSALAAVLVALVATACSDDGGGTDPDAGEVQCDPVDPTLSEAILGDDVMPAIELKISEDSRRSLEADPRKDVPAELIEDGTSHGEIAVHLKGQNSFLPFSEKAAFRLKIDEYEPCKNFHGLTDMTLNNMSTDTSMMHDRLAYYVARQANVPASRANHLLLTINNEFYGLYSNVETVKKKMIKRWFDDNDGPLFEAVDVDFTAEHVAAYELKTGPDDRSLLEGLAADLAKADPDDAIAAAATHADVDEFLRYWAMASVIGQFDAFPYSRPGDDYFVYADPTTSQLSVIPWGMDETFSAADVDVTVGGEAVMSVFAERCKASPACFQDYVDKTWATLAMIEAMDLVGERQRIADLIAPHVAEDVRKPYDAAAVEAGQLQHHYFINDRREWLQMYLPPPSP